MEEGGGVEKVHTESNTYLKRKSQRELQGDGKDTNTHAHTHTYIYIYVQRGIERSTKRQGDIHRET